MSGLTMFYCTIKPIHAAWMVDFYNHMTTEKERDVIESGWWAAGITGALIKDSKDLPSIPFEHIDQMLDLNSRNPNEEILAACELSAELLELHIDRKDMTTSDSSDSEWEDSSDR